MEVYKTQAADNEIHDIPDIDDYGADTSLENDPVCANCCLHPSLLTN